MKRAYEPSANSDSKLHNSESPMTTVVLNSLSKCPEDILRILININADGGITGVMLALTCSELYATVKAFMPLLNQINIYDGFSELLSESSSLFRFLKISCEWKYIRLSTIFTIAIECSDMEFIRQIECSEIVYVHSETRECLYVTPWSNAVVLRDSITGACDFIELFSLAHAVATSNDVRVWKHFYPTIIRERHAVFNAAIDCCSLEFLLWYDDSVTTMSMSQWFSTLEYTQLFAYFITACSEGVVAIVEYFIMLDPVLFQAKFLDEYDGYQTILSTAHEYYAPPPRHTEILECFDKLLPHIIAPMNIVEVWGNSEALRYYIKRDGKERLYGYDDFCNDFEVLVHLSHDRWTSFIEELCESAIEYLNEFHLKLVYDLILQYDCRITIKKFLSFLATTTHVNSIIWSQWLTHEHALSVLCVIATEPLLYETYAPHISIEGIRNAFDADRTFYLSKKIKYNTKTYRLYNTPLITRYHPRSTTRTQQFTSDILPFLKRRFGDLSYDFNFLLVWAHKHSSDNANIIMNELRRELSLARV